MRTDPLASADSPPEYEAYGNSRASSVTTGPRQGRKSQGPRKLFQRSCLDLRAVEVAENRLAANGPESLLSTLREFPESDGQSVGNAFLKARLQALLKPPRTALGDQLFRDGHSLLFQFGVRREATVDLLRVKFAVGQRFGQPAEIRQQLPLAGQLHELQHHPLARVVLPARRIVPAQVEQSVAELRQPGQQVARDLPRQVEEVLEGNRNAPPFRSLVEHDGKDRRQRQAAGGLVLAQDLQRDPSRRSGMAGSGAVWCSKSR